MSVLRFKGKERLKFGAVKRSDVIWIVERRFIVGGRTWTPWRPQFEIHDARVTDDYSPGYQMRQLLKEHVAFWSADWERLRQRYPYRPSGPSLRLRKELPVIYVPRRRARRRPVKRVG